jgi:hypothetical protein
MPAIEEPAVQVQQKVRNGKGGRPKKGSIPPPGQGAKPFPEPPKSRFPNGAITSEQFWGYREKLPTEFHPRMSFYVYREWPVLDFLKNWTTQQLAELKAKKRRHPIKYIGQYADIPTEEWRNFIIHCHGGGKYKIVLNDCGAPGVASGEICKTFVEINDSDAIPIIEDLSILADVDDNKKFINDLRMKGVAIPGDSKEGDSDMAAEVAVKELTNAVVTMAAKPSGNDGTNTLLAEMIKQEKERADAQRREDEARHQKEMDELKAEMKSLKDSAQHTSADPLKLVTSLVELAKLNAPPPPPPAPAPPPAAPATPQETPMERMLMKMLENEKTGRLEELKLVEQRHTREMDAINKRLEALDTRETARIHKLESTPPPVAQAVPQGSVFKEVLGALEGLTKLKEKMSPDSDNVGGTGNPFVDAAVEILPQVLTTVEKVFANRPAPIPTTPGPSGVPAVVGQPQQQAPQEQSEQQVFATYVRQLRMPLIQALQNNVSGSRFAAWLISTYGEAPYTQVTVNGSNSVMSFLQTAPEVWGELMRPPFGGALIGQFIEQFCNREAVRQALADMQAGNPPQQQQQQTGPATNGPVPVAMPTPSAANMQRPSASAMTVDALPNVKPPAAPRNQGRPEVIRGDGQKVQVEKPNGAPPPAETVQG